jgi:hypothetical protein
MTVYPGADYRRTGGNGGRCSVRVQTFHEAVTISETSVYGWNQTAKACTGYIGRYGNCEQYCELEESVNGTYQGNSYATTWESWDGLLPATGRSPDGSFGPNDRGWTPEQCERIADIIAHGYIAKGVPVRWMNATSEAGNAPHRLGVPRADGDVKIGYGPDQWTMHPGKQCPGDKRVLQLRDQIIPRAAVIAKAILEDRCTYLPRGPVDLESALARTGELGGTVGDPWWGWWAAS